MMSRLAICLCLLLTLVAGCRSRPQPAPDPSSTIPEGVAKHIPAYRLFDRRPYEFIWADRQPEQEQFLDFERLMGWQLRASEGVKTEFGRSQDTQLWDDYVGRLSYRTTTESGWILLEPPRPLPVRDPVDAATLWAYLVPQERDTQPPEIVLLLNNAHGEHLEVPLGTAGRDGWVLMHRRLPPSWSMASSYPLAVTGLRFNHVSGSVGADLYLDGLCLFMEPMNPIRYPARPQRPLPLRDGQLTGINTSEGVLHFPVTENTVIPSVSENEPPVSIARQADGSYEFSISNNQQRPVYRVDPSDHLRVTASIGEVGSSAVSLSGLLWQGVESPASMLLVARVESSQLYLEYRHGAVVRVTMRGHSLLVDASLRGREADGVAWRIEASGANMEPLTFPYLHDSWNAVMPVLLAGEGNESLFYHVQIDPYRSNASRLYLEQSESAWTVGAQYQSSTSGRRNDVHERFVITVASQLDHVLPAVPNPVSDRANTLKDRVLAGPLNVGATYREELTLAARLARTWGVRDVIYRTSADVWRQANESYSFRLRANPHRGGGAALQEFLEGVQQTGWLAALFTDYRALSPLNAFWSADHIVRDVDGAWLPHGADAYAVKPFFALHWLKEHGVSLREQFAADAVYLDHYTGSAPWTFTDYDSRIAGVGTFSQVLYADGDLLREAARTADGPVLAAGQGAWLYAGLVDGIVSAGQSTTVRPYRPQFKLHRVQPLSVVYGADIDRNLPSLEYLDAYLADQIAYGNGGRLVVVPGDPASTVRSYFALRALQEGYLLQIPRRIMYWTGTTYVTGDVAFRDGAWRRSQLYKRYPGDLEIWVNGSTEEDWDVRVGNVDYVLPPSGWVAEGPGFLALSVLQNGQRMDYVESTLYTYLDPRGRETTFGQLRGRGALVMMQAAADTFEVIDVEAAGGVGVRASVLGGAGTWRVECFDVDGQLLGDGTLVREGAWRLLDGPEYTVVYRLHAER